MRFKSRDGLMSSDDREEVALWDRICDGQASAQARGSALLRAHGVKLEHPDDGWVDRERNTITPSYPRFDDGVEVGDLIALGWPRDGYRLVRCTRIVQRRILIPTVTYSFVDTGERVEIPS